MGASRLARSPGIGCRVRAEVLAAKAQLRDQNKSTFDLLRRSDLARSELKGRMAIARILDGIP